jgi:hypothetical protein
MKLTEIIYHSQSAIDTKLDGRGRRYSVSIPCRFYCAQGHFEGYLKNLSIGGGFVESDGIPPVDTSGNLLFNSRDGRELEITAHVVHTEPLTGRTGKIEGFGLQFVSLHRESLSRLKQFLHHLELNLADNPFQPAIAAEM